MLDTNYSGTDKKSLNKTTSKHARKGPCPQETKLSNSPYFFLERAEELHVVVLTNRKNHPKYNAGSTVQIKIANMHAEG